MKEATFAQSLMERLHEGGSWPQNRAASLRYVKEAIRRHLEDVLNTRKPLQTELKGYREAARSTLNYGLDDPATMPAFAGGEALEMQSAVERCLATYEPRLTHVQVSARKSENGKIRLHISAHIPVEPSVEAVTFDTIFDLTSRAYTVQ